MENIIIKKANFKDLKLIQNLTKELINYERDILNEKYTNDNWPFTIFGYNNFKKLIKKGIIYIALKENDIIGFLCGDIVNNITLSMPFAQIYNLFVKEQYRKKHVASLLLKEFESKCKILNIEHIQLSVLNNNQTALDFYYKKNFKCHSFNLIKDI